MSNEKIASRIGKSRSTISNMIRLLNFNNSNEGKIIIEGLKNLEVTIGQVRPLLDLKPKTQLTLFKKIQKNKLSSRQVENEVKKYKNLKPVQTRDNSNKTNNWDELIGIYKINLSNYLKVPVDIRKNQKGKGRIIINYEDKDELSDIIKNKILK